MQVAVSIFFPQVWVTISIVLAGASHCYNHSKLQVTIDTNLAGSCYYQRHFSTCRFLSVSFCMVQVLIGTIQVTISAILAGASHYMYLYLTCTCSCHQCHFSRCKLLLFCICSYTSFCRLIMLPLVLFEKNKYHFVWPPSYVYKMLRIKLLEGLLVWLGGSLTVAVA